MWASSVHRPQTSRWPVEYNSGEHLSVVGKLRRLGYSHGRAVQVCAHERPFAAVEASLDVYPAGAWVAYEWPQIAARVDMHGGDDLNGILGYQLQVANLAAVKDAQRALQPYGLSPAKFTALLLVRANPGCDQTALGRALRINRSSAMKLVNVLVERGFLERRTGRDMRTNALFLPPGAEATVVAMLAAVQESDRSIAAALNTAELNQLRSLLTRIGAACGDA